MIDAGKKVYRFAVAEFGIQTTVAVAAASLVDAFALVNENNNGAQLLTIDGNVAATPQRLVAFIERHYHTASDLGAGLLRVECLASQRNAAGDVESVTMVETIEATAASVRAWLGY